MEKGHTFTGNDGAIKAQIDFIAISNNLFRVMSGGRNSDNRKANPRWQLQHNLVTMKLRAKQIFGAKRGIGKDNGKKKEIANKGKEGEELRVKQTFNVKKFREDGRGKDK